MAQVVGPGTDAAAGWFESEAAEHAPDDVGSALDGKCLSIGADEERRLRLSASRAIPLKAIVPQFMSQIGSERDPARLAFALPDAEHAAIQIYVPNLQSHGFTESQSGAVQNQDQHSNGRPGAASAAQTLSLAEQGAHLIQRQDMGNELRMNGLGRPLAAGNEAVRMKAEAVSEKLPQRPQLQSDRDGLSLTGPREPATKQIGQRQRALGVTVGQHVPIKTPEGVNRSVIGMAQHLPVRHEALQLGSKWAMEDLAHRGTGRAIARRRRKATRT
jgi:hypothetical protein